MTVPYQKIKEYYKEMEMDIINSKLKWCYAYAFDWMSMFTPIEQDAWQAIRYYGRVPFYPQYPVDKYFLDFANPYLKIGIECDGKEFHQDKEKDLGRDTHLSKLGWIIYRVSGADCVRICEDYNNRDDIQDKYEKADIIENFYRNTVDGLIQAIGIIHCGFDGFDLDKNELNRICYTVLDKRIAVKTGNDFKQLHTRRKMPVKTELDDDDGWTPIGEAIMKLIEHQNRIAESRTNPF
jgi:very-short-patch-repair endonuclease